VFFTLTRFVRTVIRDVGWWTVVERPDWRHGEVAEDTAPGHGTRVLGMLIHVTVEGKVG
jgi:hypothetical protein